MAILKPKSKIEKKDEAGLGVPTSVDRNTRLSLQNIIENLKKLLSRVKALEDSVDVVKGDVETVSGGGGGSGGSVTSNNYKGTWNASSGTPPSTLPVAGQYWRVDTAGTTSLSSIDNWDVNDLAVYQTDSWQKIPAIQFASDGIIVQTDDFTYATRVITAPAAGITVSNGGGVAGNPTLALADDLAGLEAITGTGMVARTAANAFSTRTIAGTSSNISVTNGDGVAGAPTIDLINTITAGGPTGSSSVVPVITYDAKGRLTAVTTATITPAAIGAQPVDATLTSLAAYNTNGLLTQTAADTFTGRTVTGTTNQITVTNGSGVAGNPTISLPAVIDLTGKTISGGTIEFVGIENSNIETTNIDNSPIGSVSPNTGAFTNLVATTQIMLGDGSASDPSLAFLSTVDTGLYTDLNNTLRFTNNGTHTMTLDASNRVVIGSETSENDATGVESLLQTHGFTSSAGTSQHNWGSNSQSAQLNFFKGKSGTIGSIGGGSVGTGSSIATGNNAGPILWYADDGVTTTGIQLAGIRGACDITPTNAGFIAGRFVFQLGDGSTGVNNTLVMNSTGDTAFGLGVNAPAISGSPKMSVVQETLGEPLHELKTTSTNDDPTETFYQNRVTTTDATVTTLHTFTLNSAETCQLEVTVVARRTGGASGTAQDGAGYKFIGTYKSVGGTATLIGAVSAVHTAEDQAGWAATLTVSGGNVLCQVTGAASNNVTWHMHARRYNVGT